MNPLLSGSDLESLRRQSQDLWMYKNGNLLKGKTTVKKLEPMNKMNKNPWEFCAIVESLNRDRWVTWFHLFQGQVLVVIILLITRITWEGNVSWSFEEVEVKPRIGLLVRMGVFTLSRYCTRRSWQGAEKVIEERHLSNLNDGLREIGWLFFTLCWAWFQLYLEGEQTRNSSE